MNTFAKGQQVVCIKSDSYTPLEGFRGAVAGEQYTIDHAPRLCTVIWLRGVKGPRAARNFKAIEPTTHPTTRTE